MRESIGKFRIKFSRSLRLDLFLIICLVGIIPGAILSEAFLSNYEKKAVETRIRTAKEQCLIISDHLYQLGYPDAAENGTASSELALISDLYDGRVMLIGPDLKAVKDTYSRCEGRYIVSAKAARGLLGESSSEYDSDSRMIEIVTPISARDAEPVGVMLTYIGTSDIASVLENSRKLCTLLLLALSAIALGIAIVVAAKIIGQFRRLSASVENIRYGFDEEKISIFDYRETAQINDAFNQVITRMKNLDDSRSEFVANVSHELKTPITSIKLLAESITAEPDAPKELYGEFMSDIIAEVDREDKIINDLLSLVKMDRTATDLKIEKCDIDTMLEGIIKRLMPIADRDKVELIFETIRPVIAEVDETKLSSAFTNIIENGIKYNHEGGTVKITLDSEPMQFVVTVEDTGIGIPKEDIPNIFERFYRVDKSHSREIGGTGLGLAIARSSILMHKGTVKVDSTPGEGSRFEIKIPLSYIVAPASEAVQENEAKEGRP
ncbi:MAG: ATP-binding protein [Lachnospiraceae bacterium]|nr:ATP-binding protein [Lachnospiraceae bacterium]